jgi:hypothetical protein
MNARQTDASVHLAPSTLALFTLTEIKAAAEGFDRGDTNVFDALDEIVVAVATYQQAVRHRPGREAA